MLQHRQVVKAADVCALCDEHILASDANEDVKNKEYVKFNVVEALSGSITQTVQFPANKRTRNTRIVVTPQHIFQYDYLCGMFSVIDRRDSHIIAQLNKRPPPNTFIATSCASQLHDGMFFYAYGSNSTEEMNSSNLLSSVYAILVGEENAVMSLAMHTEYKNSGFTEKNLGRIVSLHCHPSKPFLFVVFSKGAVQVWSYAKCHQHLQQELGGHAQSSANFGGINDSASVAGGNDIDDEASDFGGPDDASEHGGSSVSGAHNHTLSAGGSVRSGTGSVKIPSRGAFAGLGPSNKQIQSKLLKAVASFAIPSHKQLMRLDNELESLLTAPSSFRLDARGRFAAVVWSERVVCVYDIYTLLMLHMLQKPLNANSHTNSRGASASSIRNETVNVVQLSIFGAFPCRALPSPNGVEYSFGPVAFHPTAQVLLVTVLRHRQVPRLELTSTTAYRNYLSAMNNTNNNTNTTTNYSTNTNSSTAVPSAGINTTIIPMSSLLYAVSLAVHQPILSAIGSYDLGSDVDLKTLGGGTTAGSISTSINWRPRNIDCTPHSGVIAVTFQTVSTTSHRKDGYNMNNSALDSTHPNSDIHSDPTPAALAAALNAEDMQDLDQVYNPNNNSSIEGVTSTFNPSTESSSTLVQHTSATHMMLLYSFSAAWLRSMGLITSTVPILNTLPIAPDVYLFGEGVLSSKSAYTLRDSSTSTSTPTVTASATTVGAITTSVSTLGLTSEPSAPPAALTVRSLALTETTAMPVNSINSTTANTTVNATTSAEMKTQVSDQYPLLLALRTAFDGADEGLSVNSIAVGYHLFRTHWVHPAVSNNNTSTTNTTNNSTNTNNTNNNTTPNNTDGLEGSSATHIGMLPALLTSAVLEAAQRTSHEWITLSDEDHLALSGWDSDGETAGAHVIHTFCPTKLVTKESAGLSSLQHSWCSPLVGATNSGIGDFDAILIGTVRRAVASSTLYSVAESADINHISSTRLLPCVCYLKYDTTAGFSVAHSNHRDAAYWVRNTTTTATSTAVVSSTITDLSLEASQDTLSVGVLALCRSGLQVQHLVAQPAPTIGDSTSAFDNDLFAEPSTTNSSYANVKETHKVVSVSATYTLGAEMSALWTSPVGAPNIILFASPSPYAASVSSNNTYRQSLHATYANPSVSDFGAVGREKQQGKGHVLQLMAQEEVLDIQWQPMPSALGVKSAHSSANATAGATAATAAAQALQQVWLLHPNEPLLAVRTTHRVLICTHTLRVLNAVTYCESRENACVKAMSAESTTSAFLQRLLSASGSTQPSPASSAASASPSILQDAVLGITWIGAALSYTCESGAIYYLLPGPCVGAVDLNTRRLGTASSPLYRAAFLRMPSLRARTLGTSGDRDNQSTSAQKSEMNRGLLCSLPRNISTSLPGSHRVVAVLSDRLLVSYLRRDDAYHSVTTLPQLAFTQRPLNPVEPLILGLMALHYLRAPQQARRLPVPYAQDCITTLLSYYISPKRDPSAGGAGGAHPTAQCSNKLTLALSQYQPLIPVGMETPSIHKGSITNLSVSETPPSASNNAGLLAAVTAGMTVEQTRGSSSSREFPTARWIASGFKFYTALQSRMVKHAALEQLSSRAELQELLLEQDAYGGSAVPHMHRPLAAQLAASAILFYLQSSVHAKTLTQGLNSTTMTVLKDLSHLEGAIACRLLDIGGDYATLSALLMSEGRKSNNTNLISEAHALLDTVVSPLDRAAYLALHARCRALHRDWSPATIAAAVNYVLQGRFSLSALGASSRLKHLTSGSNRVEIADVHNLSTSQLSQWEAQLREHAARSGAQQGPPVVSCSSAAATSLTLPIMGPRCGGLLAMDLLEDFMGINLQLELSSVSAADLFHTAGANDGHADNLSGTAGGLNGMYLGQPIPTSWVDGVGTGNKEHELIVAYYRFSDVAYQGDEGFHCSSLNPFATRMVFLDLSRFEGPGLEVYSHTASAFKVELSTSPVDPGEKHENVKSLCDVLYCPSESDNSHANSNLSDFAGSDPFADSSTHNKTQHSVSLQRGLRCPVLRGSQLDIGMYHEDSHRAKMTLEITVCFDEGIANSGSDATVGGIGSAKAHILAQRLAHTEHAEHNTHGSHTNDNNIVLWTLYVSAEGEVCFVFGPVGAAGATVLKSAADAVTLPSRQAISAGAGIADQNNNIGSANWTHIALILDSSKSTVSHTNNQLTQTNANVTLCVKGDTFDAKIAPPSVNDAHLLHTTLLVGPNLCAGWRLTELRMWADTRSINDLESMKENYLVMAMKRKRLQLRVKGTKKMFTAYREIDVPAMACTALKAPTASQEQKNTEESADTAGNPTNTSSASSVKSLAAPLGSKALSTAPLPFKPFKAAEKSDISSAATAATTANATAAESTDPASALSATAPAAAAPAMSARERRMSMLKGGVSAPATAPKGGVSAPVTVPKGGLLAPNSPKPHKAPVQVEFDSVQDISADHAASPAGSTPHVSFAAFDAFPEPAATKPAGAAVVAKDSHSVAPVSPVKPPITNATAVTSSSAASSPVPLKSAASFSFTSAAVASSATFLHHKTLSELVNNTTDSNTNTDTWEKYTSAKPLALPPYYLQCQVPTPIDASSNPSALVRGIQAVAIAGSTHTVTPCAGLSAEVRRTAESVIVTFVPSTTTTANATSKCFRIAVLAKQVISVYSTTLDTTHTAELVAQVSLATVKLLFWTFISPDIIFLITPSAGFTLKVTGTASATGCTAIASSAVSSVVLNPKPAKIFDRIDVRDKNTWKNRTVLDLQVCSDGWTLLLTADTATTLNTTLNTTFDTTTSSTTSSTTNSTQSSARLLTLYHARSGRSVSFVAAGGCFRFGVAQVLIVHEDAHSHAHSRAEAPLSVTAIDLSDITKYWEAEGIAAVVPGAISAVNPTTAHHKEPLLLLALPSTLHAQWTLSLASTDKKASFHSPPVSTDESLQIDTVAAACLDQITDSNLPALRIVSRMEGAIVDVSLKSFSKAISSPEGLLHQLPQPTPHTKAVEKPNSPCALSNALPRSPLHVWSIGKLVYVLTERGLLHQCSVGGALPQYVGAAWVPLPLVKAAPKVVPNVPAVPIVQNAPEEDFAPTVAPAATAAAKPAFSATSAATTTATTATANVSTTPTASSPLPSTAPNNTTKGISPKPVVRNWTDNPGFGLKKPLRSSPSPVTSPSVSPTVPHISTDITEAVETVENQVIKIGETATLNQDSAADGNTLEDEKLTHTPVPLEEIPESPTLSATTEIEVAAQARVEETGEGPTIVKEVNEVELTNVQDSIAAENEDTTDATLDVSVPTKGEDGQEGSSTIDDAKVDGVDEVELSASEQEHISDIVANGADDSVQDQALDNNHAEHVVDKEYNDTAAAAVAAVNKGEGVEDATEDIVTEMVANDKASQPETPGDAGNGDNGSDVSSVVSLEMASSSNEDA